MTAHIKMTAKGSWIYMELHAETCAPGLAIDFPTLAEAKAQKKARGF